MIHGWVIFNATACCPVLCEALAGQQEGPQRTAQVVLSSSLESLQRSKAAQGRADPRQRCAPCVLRHSSSDSESCFVTLCLSKRRLCAKLVVEFQGIMCQWAHMWLACLTECECYMTHVGCANSLPRLQYQRSLWHSRISSTGITTRILDCFAIRKRLRCMLADCVMTKLASHTSGLTV